MVLLMFFIAVAGVVSYIDIKKGLILDIITIPSFFVLLLLKYLENSLSMYDFLAVAIVLTIFVIPIVLNMAFGGGDLRFGAFCALFLGVSSLGYFIMLAGLFHLILLKVLNKESFAFAPAMSLGAIGAYIMGMGNL